MLRYYLFSIYKKILPFWIRLRTTFLLIQRLGLYFQATGPVGSINSARVPGHYVRGALLTWSPVLCNIAFNLSNYRPRIVNGVFLRVDFVMDVLFLVLKLAYNIIMQYKCTVSYCKITHCMH